MGRFHRHPDGTAHSHDHSHDGDRDHRHGDDDHHHGDDDHHHGDQGQPAPRDVGDHSGYETGFERVQVLEQILGENDRVAARNRSAFDEHGVGAVNLMSSPGAGKTTLLARTIARLGSTVRLGILEGDIATSIDADILSNAGAVVSLVNTEDGFGGECHLDAPMVASGLGRLPLDELDLVVIENVGNLVCPAEFDVGQHRRAMVYAITEGEEKPLKYPVMFRAAEVIVVNKIDLLPHLDFDMDAFRANLANINPTAPVIELSARTGDGLDDWVAWLTSSVPR